MIDALIKKAAKAQYVRLHALPGNKGKEVHHIYGRIGILHACPLLMVALTNSEHNDYMLLKALRAERLKWKKAVLNNYQRGEGCKENIGGYCAGCLMLQRSEK